MPFLSTTAPEGGRAGWAKPFVRSFSDGGPFLQAAVGGEKCSCLCKNLEASECMLSSLWCAAIKSRVFDCGQQCLDNDESFEMAQPAALSLQPSAAVSLQTAGPSHGLHGIVWLNTVTCLSAIPSLVIQLVTGAGAGSTVLQCVICAAQGFLVESLHRHDQGSVYIPQAPLNEAMSLLASNCCGGKAKLSFTFV